MKVTFEEVSRMFDTLPISFYSGRGIPHELSRESMSTSYDIYKDKIVVSFPTIQRMLKDVPAGNIQYSVIRGLLYHEVAHAILTPTAIVETEENKEHHRVLNVFEDERIETLLKNYFLEVNFRRNIVLLNNYKGEEARTAFSAFYNLVRFHKGETKWLTRLMNIIMEYRYLSANADEWKVKQYTQAVMDFYNDFTEDWEKEQEEKRQQEQEQQSQSNQSEESDEQENNESTESNNNAEEDEENEQNKSSNEQSEDNEGEGSEDEDNGSEGSSEGSDEESDENEEDDEASNGSSDEENEENDEEDDVSYNPNATEDEGDEGDEEDPENSEGSNEDESEEEDKSRVENEEDEGIDPELEETLADIDELDVDDFTKDEMKSAVDSVLNDTFEKFTDPELETRLRNILEKKLRKTQQRSAAISAYSGVMNYRNLLTRDDWKVWERPNTQGNGRRFGATHITFFLDTSWSFRNNDTRMNIFIRTLERLAQNYPAFTFDIITISSYIEEWTTIDRKFCSFQENSIFKENMTDRATKQMTNIPDLLKRHRKTNAENYLVVLFDGDAHFGEYNVVPSASDTFRILDGGHNIIVTDEQNRKYIEPSVHSAKVHYCKRYMDEFTSAVCDLLDRVL